MRMRLFTCTLLVVGLASCSGHPSPPKEEKPPVAPASTGVQVEMAIAQGKTLEYACSADKIPQLEKCVASLKGLAPGVASLEFKDRTGGLHFAGHIDDHGVIQAQKATNESGDYQLFLGILFLLPRGPLAPGATLGEDVQLQTDPEVTVWGKVSWKLGDDDFYLGRNCKMCTGEATLDLAHRKDGRRMGRMKARLSVRYDAAAKALLAVEARVKSNYQDPDAVDAAQESTVLLHLRE